MTKHAPRTKGRTVQRILRQVRTNLQKTLVQQIAQYKEYLVAAHIEGWPYTVQVVVEMPEDLVERLREQGRKNMEEKLKQQLSPDARLQVAAQEGVEQPQVDRPAGKGFRTSDHIQTTPDPLLPDSTYHTPVCTRCGGRGIVPSPAHGLSAEPFMNCPQCRHVEEATE